jgi:hypothetical protein
VKARMLPKASRRKSAQRSQTAPAEGKRPLGPAVRVRTGALTEGLA